MGLFLVSQHPLVLLSVLSLTRAQTTAVLTTTVTPEITSTKPTATSAENTTVTPGATTITSVPTTAAAAETTTRVETSTAGITTRPDPTTPSETTTSTTTVSTTTATITPWTDAIIGVQMKFTSFLDLTQSGNIEVVLQQIKQALISRGVSSHFELKLRKVKKTVVVQYMDGN